MNSRNRLFFLLLITFLSVILPVRSSGNNLNPDEFTIQFPSKEMTLKKALDVLFLQKEFNVVYGGKEIDIDVPIVFSSLTLKLREALSQIERQAPVEFIINNKHIIVKKRKLERSYKVSGVIRDKATNEPLVAADVVIAGTTTGVVTDINGNFSIQLKPGIYPFVFRYMGYHSNKQAINLYNDVNLNIYLDVKQHEIGAVDVKGSNEFLENMKVGRSIEKIDAKTMGKLNTNDVSDALHGRLNGVWTTKVSGAPGNHNKIRIRGISSFFGTTEPLYVVDGAIIPIVNFHNLGISDLNANDVENLTVLKDASSTALYGNLGSNGVIIIDTKKGGGKKQFDFKVKQGFQTFNKRYDLMGAEDFFNTLRTSDSLMLTNFYHERLSLDKFRVYPYYYDANGNALDELDFQNELFKTGIINEYQFSAKGSCSSIDYYLSGNYYNHNGVIINTNYNKYSFTANLSKVVENKYSIRLLYKASIQENTNTLDNYLGNKTILKGINYEPAYVATPDSFFEKPQRLFYNIIETPTMRALSSFRLPPKALYYDNDKIKTDKGNSINLQGFYKINTQFSLRGIASYSFHKLSFTSNNISNIDYIKQFLKSTELFSFFNYKFDLNYKKEFQEHQLTTFIRYRGYFDKIYWSVDSINNITYDGIGPENDIFLRGSQVIYGEQGAVLRSIHSGIFNANYNYKNKYFFSVILNYENLKEGSFVSSGNLYKSFAVNYDLSKEEILHFPGWINEFNVFFNWGESGNYPLNSLSDNLYSDNSVYTANNEIVPGVYISNLANKKIRPEKVREVNCGLKLALFNNRCLFSGDYYKKVNNDLLIKRPIPLTYGGGFIFYNIGEMKNSGFEMSLEAIFINNKNSYWSSKTGFSTNNQYITRLNDGEPIRFINTDIFIPDFIIHENKKLGAIYGYQYVGRWKDYYDPEYGNKHPNYIEDRKLAYARNDSLMNFKIQESDKGIIGNSLPDFTFNWLNIFEYKNFEIEMLWYGVSGIEKYNATKAATFVTGLNSEVRNIVLDTINCLNSNVFYESSYFMEDASFVRLKTLSFTYRQAKKIMGRISMEYTLSFENLITITNYSGYDPEAAIYTDNNFTDNAIDRGAYPNPQGVYFTINMKL